MSTTSTEPTKSAPKRSAPPAPEPPSTDQATDQAADQPADQADQPAANQAIIDATLELIVTRGPRIKLHEIAAHAGLSAYEVREHYPSVESILAGFLVEIFETAGAQVEAIDGIEEFALREKIHAFLEAVLDQLEPHRAVVPRVSLMLGLTNLRNRQLIKHLRSRFSENISAYFSEAIDANEIPDVDVNGSVVQSFADYATTVIMHWLRDESPQHRATTEFIDQTLNVVIPAAVSSARLRDLGSFLRRRVQTVATGGSQGAGGGRGGLFASVRGDEPTANGRPVSWRPRHLRHRFMR